LIILRNVSASNERVRMISEGSWHF